jgi:hypothetical protein
MSSTVSEIATGRVRSVAVAVTVAVRGPVAVFVGLEGLAEAVDAAAPDKGDGNW